MSARCCATTGAVATLLVHAWLDSGYTFCVFSWVRYGRISHNFYVNPASGGGLQGFRPGQSSSASFSSPAGVRGEGVFRTFHWFKKVRSSPRVRVRGCPPVAAHGLGRLLARVLWSTTTTMAWRLLRRRCWQRVNQDLSAHLVGPSRSVLATCSSSGRILLVEPGHSAHPMAAAVGQLSWWTYRQPRAVYK